MQIVKTSTNLDYQTSQNLIYDYLNIVDNSNFKKEYDEIFINNIERFYEFDIFNLGDKKEELYLIKYFNKILEKIDDNVSGSYQKIRLANNLLRYLENKTPTADIVILFNLIFNKIKNIDGLFLEEY